MNDAHIYCTTDQLREELTATFDLTLHYYSLFRFQNVQVRFSTHDGSKPDKFVDNPELWNFSEGIVREIIEAKKIDYVLGSGEAAFYGPKIDFQAATLLGREETISTTQLDFAQPLRFNLTYIAEDGKEHRPYVVHRAPLGTHERFIAFLIEHFGGAFPTWMAPIQVRIIAVADDFSGYAAEIQKLLREQLVRVDLDASNNSFNKKIREAVTHKIPNILIVGGKEKETRSVSLRRYAVKEQSTLTLDRFIEGLTKGIKTRLMDNFPEVSLF